MIYWQLFLSFLEIGAVSFGGGYAMISMIREKALHHGWMTEEELLNLVAVAESTPGPIAVNAATFVGATQAGLPGALLATLGVVLPSFLIILLIAAVMHNFLKYRGVNAFLSGVRPCVVGLILATALVMAAGGLFGLRTVGDAFAPDLRAIGIFLVLAAAAHLWKRFRKRAPSPILLILLSAGLGMVLYALPI